MSQLGSESWKVRKEDLISTRIHSAGSRLFPISEFKPSLKSLKGRGESFLLLRVNYTTNVISTTKLIGFERKD